MKLCGKTVGLDQPFFLIAGPCAIEHEALALSTADTLVDPGQPLAARLRPGMSVQARIDTSTGPKIR